MKDKEGRTKYNHRTSFIFLGQTKVLPGYAKYEYIIICHKKGLVEVDNC